MASITLNNGDNIIIGTGAGSMIGTAANETLAFYGATPIVQPANTSDLRALLIALGLLASGGTNDLDTNGGNVTAQTFNTEGSNASYYVNRRDTNAPAFQIYSSSGDLGIYNDSLTTDAMDINATTNLVTMHGGFTSYGSSTFVSTALFNSNIIIADSSEIEFGSSSGTKIGTATTQKLSFYNATPIVQPTGDVQTALVNLGLIASPTWTSNITFTAAITFSAELLVTGSTLLEGTLYVGGTATLSDIIIGDGYTVAVGTTVGTMIGTASTQKIAFLGATPAVQQTGGVKTAGATYGSNEQTMLQDVYSALRTFGFLS